MTPPKSEDGLPTLHTARLDLRPLDPYDEEDCQKLIKVYNDNFTAPWGFGKAKIKTSDDVRSLCRRNKPKRHHCTKLSPSKALPESTIHMVYERGLDEHIGIAFVYFRDDLPYPDIGYAFFEPSTGKGYATEAASAVKDWWYDDMGVHEIMAAVYDNNVASLKCATRIGLIEGGNLTVAYSDGTQQHEKAFVLPGMKWPAEGMVLHVTKGKEDSLSRE